MRWLVKRAVDLSLAIIGQKRKQFWGRKFSLFSHVLIAPSQHCNFLSRLIVHNGVSRCFELLPSCNDESIVWRNIEGGVVQRRRSQSDSVRPIEFDAMKLGVVRNYITEGSEVNISRPFINLGYGAACIFSDR